MNNNNSGGGRYIGKYGVTTFNVCFIFNETESIIGIKMMQKALGFTRKRRKLKNVIQESEGWPAERVCDLWAVLREYLKFGITNLLYIKHGLCLHVFLVSFSYIDIKSE